MTSLSAQQWERVAAEFDRLHEAPAATRRAAVDALAVDDPLVAQELEALLESADRTDSLLDRKALDVYAAMHASSPALLGRRLGAYEVTRVIGRGGMGVVFEGRHTAVEFTKRVAIKTLAIGVERPERLWRFRRERQILAGLEHPNIATLFDGGTTDDGIPYLVMEYVDGERIDDWSDERRLTVTQRIDLFLQVCAAVQYAHQKLIVHRDLKPGNILVTQGGVVKLLDFGIAKLLAADEERDETTRGGIAPLTTAYASPEQARGETITTAADVYSLGVVLYRLLTGNAPYDVEGRSPAEVLRILSTQEPRTPSAGVTNEHARSCGVSDARPLQATISGELDAILLMALRKEPDRRYPSVEAFSSDLLRYLKGLPVQARPDTVAYRVRKFVVRQRALVAGVSIALVALTAATVTSSLSANVAREEARRAQRMAQYLQAVVGAADPAHYSTFRSGTNDVTMREVLDSTRARVASDLGDDPQLRADLYWTLGGSYRTFGRYDVAATLFDSARVLHTATRGASSIEVTRDIHFRGLIDQETGRPDSALARFGDALRRYRGLAAAPDSEVVDILVSFGQALAISLQRPDSALPYLREATERERRRAAPRWALLGIAESVIGTSLMQQGDTVASDAAYTRAIEALQRDSIRSSVELGFTYINWGTALGRRDQHERAAVLQRRGVTTLTTALGRDNFSVATAQSRLANELLLLSRLGEGRALIDSSIVTLQAITPVNPVELCYSLRVRAALEVASGERAQAALTLAQAQGWLGQSGAARPVLEVNLMLVAADLAGANGDMKAARGHLDAAATLARSKLGAQHASTRLADARLAKFTAEAPNAK
ncbi:MAG: serine/threonine-protein kinase [Gemmatimonadaceae bacterium]|nr:serine/threonine-protein kinase [Gemmatimonadaceae bacterium]